MGDLISLEQHRQAVCGERRRARAGTAQVVFAFDLASPFTYLAAERIERSFARVVWRPVWGDALGDGHPNGAADAERLFARAGERADALRMPLVWPDGFPAPVPSAMRVAALAAERGKAGGFVLAACRLAFCGGFDLEDPEVLAEAAAAACLGLDECLAAAQAPDRDGRMEEAGRRLMAQGADRLPAVRVGRTLFCGEDRIAEALAAVRAPAPARRHAP
jgi:2-hydroxychromene-2-carboxylate isomerase